MFSRVHDGLVRRISPWLLGRHPYNTIFSFNGHDIRRLLAFLGRAAELLPRRKITIIDVGELFPVSVNSVECILFNQVLEHVLDPEKPISEIYRALKPGGLCIGSVPHISLVHLEPHDYQRHTAPDLGSLFKSHNYQNIAIEGSGGAYLEAALLVAMNLVLSPQHDDESHKDSENRAFWFFPIVGLINLFALVVDSLSRDTRRYSANLYWVAIKPK